MQGQRCRVYALGKLTRRQLHTKFSIRGKIPHRDVQRFGIRVSGFRGGHSALPTKIGPKAALQGLGCRVYGEGCRV